MRHERFRVTAKIAKTAIAWDGSERGAFLLPLASAPRRGRGREKWHWLRLRQSLMLVIEI